MITSSYTPCLPWQPWELGCKGAVRKSESKGPKLEQLEHLRYVVPCCTVISITYSEYVWKGQSVKFNQLVGILGIKVHFTL